MCEFKQILQKNLDKIEIPDEQREEVNKQIRNVVEDLSSKLVNKTLELSMYRHAIASKGSDAQLMLKASIDDLMALKLENNKLRDQIDGKNFEKTYCAQ